MKQIKRLLKKLTIFTNQLYTKFNLTNLVSKYYCNYYIKYMFYNLLITDIRLLFIILNKNKLVLWSQLQAYIWKFEMK